MNELSMQDKRYLIITDYVEANTGKDVADAIQKVIDDNPRRTIFFPDGEYIISKPICTSGHFSKAVSLELSNFAIIKASEDWSSDEAMIRLGGKDPYFRIGETGTNNYICGGILDGSCKAKGLSVDSGREYSIRNISMKYVEMGIHIKFNEVYVSNDSDIFNVNIVGLGNKGSVGLLVNGYDNTFTNMRIANFETGVKITGGANMFRNIHPLFIYAGDGGFYHKDEKIDYVGTVGFDDLSNGCWYDYCYADNFEVCFRMGKNCRAVYDNCYCFWYHIPKDRAAVGFEATDKFNAVIKNARVDMRATEEGAFLKVAVPGGKGVVQDPFANDFASKDETYKEYLRGNLIWN